MAKTTKTPVTEYESFNSNFPVPFTQEAFQKDITEVFLYYVRSIAWMIDGETGLSLLKLPADTRPHHLFMAEFKAVDLELTFDLIRHTEFAKALDKLYEFAYFGWKDHSQEPIEYESIHAWMTCLVCDARDGEMAREWEEYGWLVKDCAARCVQVAETANARITLEGAEPFFLTFQYSGKEGYLSSSVLTVRQLSLLSGLEEMSIRAAANPKRPSPLKTITTDHGTRIEIEVAKEWLKSKGRYVPIADIWTAGEINLATSRFESLGALDSALQARYAMFCNKGGHEGLRAVLAQADIKTTEGKMGPILDLTPDNYQNDGQIRVVAHALELPIELLQLRIKEALAHENLRAIEGALRVAMQNPQ